MCAHPSAYYYFELNFLFTLGTRFSLASIWVGIQQNVDIIIIIIVIITITVIIDFI